MGHATDAVRWAGWAERTRVVGLCRGGRTKPHRGKWKGDRKEGGRARAGWGGGERERERWGRGERDPLSPSRLQHSKSEPIQSLYQPSKQTQNGKYQMLSVLLIIQCTIILWTTKVLCKIIYKMPSIVQCTLIAEMLESGKMYILE